VLDLPQSRTETLLRARVQELGGTIEQRVELVRLAERGGAVDATLRDAAGREIEVSAGYVVGCDGAHSRVRHEIRLPFEGQPYPQDWLLADVALDGADSDGAFKSKPWWDRAAAAGGIAGLAALVPYRIAASSTGVSGPGLNSAIHIVGSAAVLLVVLVPALEHRLTAWLLGDDRPRTRQHDGDRHHYRPVRDPTHGSAASVSALSARG
jgi:2-polyprenyl-6-methoxyphenol hydroxylase-like FAD-dependent oxidoreductase